MGEPAAKRAKLPELEEAQHAVDRGDLLAAATAFRASLAAQPRSHIARLGLASALRGDADQDQLVEVEELLAGACQGPGGVAREARSKLALLLAQEGREDEADVHMLRLGCRYRLADVVLRYALQPDESSASGCEYAACFDSALQPAALAHLQRCFAPDAPFWTAHAYQNPSTGYFSYTHSLRQPPRCAFEQLLATLVARATAWCPAASSANAVEWWAHCRPHGSGHQMHFDSADEGASAGGPMHPLVSTVLFLDASCGGPTLVTPQRRHGPGAALAKTGWLAHGREGRLLCFDGGVLHGVLPGRGPTPRQGSRRVTLMVALWPQQEARDLTTVGAARAFPVGPNAPAWALQLAGGPPRPEWELLAAQPTVDAPLSQLPCVWQDVKGNEEVHVRLAQLEGLPHYSLCFQGF
jgi:hypothetical protein